MIDPWKSFIAGADENNFKEISGATKFLDQLIADRGLTLFMAVHEGKNPNEVQGGIPCLQGGVMPSLQ